jgi:hypothetical protein
MQGLFSYLDFKMKSKILITVENGRITSAVANGNTELYVNVLETLDGPQKVYVVAVTNEQLETLLAAGRSPIPQCAAGILPADLNSPAFLVSL